MLQGSLDNFTLDEVLALLSSTHKTGHLRISGDRGTGSLWLADGDLVGAEASSAPGVEDWEDIMFELLRFQSGNFSFIVDEVQATTGDPVGVEEMVAAGQELIGEWRGIESVVPSLDHFLAPVPELPSEQVMLTNSEWQAIQSVGEGASVGETCRSLAVGELKGCRRIKGIVERGLVSISDPTTAAAAAVAEAEAQAAQTEENLAEAADDIPEPAGVGRFGAPAVGGREIDGLEAGPAVDGIEMPASAEAPVLLAADFASEAVGVDLPASTDPAEADSDARPPMPAPPNLENAADAGASLPPAPPSPAEIAGFGENLSGTQDLSAPPAPPPPPDLAAPADLAEAESAEDDEAGLLLRYLKSES